MNRTISIVIPFFNERENIPLIYRDLQEAIPGFGPIDCEILFMDNASSDGSDQVVLELQKTDPRIRLIRMVRNFGYQANILAGYHYCKGDAAVQLDADGEDDPRLISAFIKKWLEGYHVVFGIRVRRKEGFIIQVLRKVFYRFLNSISTIPIPVDAGDFRLIDRQVIDSLKQFNETHLYLRGLVAYCGFKQTGFEYERRPRYTGVSKFSMLGYIRLATDAILSFSVRPLEFMTSFGLAISLLSFVAGLGYVGLHFMAGTRAPGFTTLAFLVSFFSGVQILFMGVVGSYVGRIFEEVKHRPRSISFEITPSNPLLVTRII